MSQNFDESKADLLRSNLEKVNTFELGLADKTGFIGELLLAKWGYFGALDRILDLEERLIHEKAMSLFWYMKYTGDVPKNVNWEDLQEDEREARLELAEISLKNEGVL